MKSLGQLLPLSLVLLSTFFTWQALLSPGFFTIHDNQQVGRLFEMHKALMAGQFPVRWVEGLGFGFGYPLFNFYPPLVYYLGEIGVLGGLGFIDSIKLVWFISLVGSSIAMYFLAKEFWGKLGGIVSAMFYLYAPYHALDAYVRGAMAELFSFVWLPLILLFSYKATRASSLKYTVLTGVALALLMITHNLIFLPFFGFYILWHLSMSLIYKRHWYEFLISTILAFGLSAFFWLPALWEKQYTLVDSLLIKNLASYKIHFVCLEQLWQSNWGFGGSAPGCTADGVSFMVGKLHLLMSLAGLPTAVYFWRKKQRDISLLLIFSLFFLGLSLFMTTSYSQSVWDLVPQLWYLQFPWRFLEFSALFSAFLAGAVVVFVGQLGSKIKLITAVAFIIIIIFIEAKYFQPQTYLPFVTDQQTTSDEAIQWDVSASSFEYLPKGIATKITDKGTVWVDIDRTEIRNSHRPRSGRAKFEIRNGDFLTRREIFVPGEFELVGESINGAVLEIQTVNFPGWEARIDDGLTKINDDNKYKLITVTVPAGEHRITGGFADTPVRKIGNTISLMTLVIIIGGWFITRSGWKLQK